MLPHFFKVYVFWHRDLPMWTWPPPPSMLQTSMGNSCICHVCGTTNLWHSIPHFRPRLDAPNMSKIYGFIIQGLRCNFINNITLKYGRGIGECQYIKNREEAILFLQFYFNVFSKVILEEGFSPSFSTIFCFLAQIFILVTISSACGVNITH